MHEQEPTVPEHIAPEYRDEYRRRLQEAQANTKKEPLLIYDRAKLNADSAQAHEGVNFLAVEVHNAVTGLRSDVDQMGLPEGIDRRDLKLQAELVFLRSLAESGAKGELLDTIEEREEAEGDLFPEGVGWAIGVALDKLQQEQKMGEALRRS